MKIKCVVCKGVDTKQTLKAYNSHGRQTYSKRRQFIYYKCFKCEALFLSKVVVNSNFYKTYYPKKYRETVKRHSLLGSLFTKYSHMQKVKIFEKYLNKKRIKLLDIGSGDGSFLISLDKSKYNASGLEISHSYDKSYVNNKLKLIVGNYLTKRINNKFDIVTGWHVIEHLSNPNMLFRKTSRVLSSKGLFVFSIPNYKSMGFEKGKEEWFHLDAPRHLLFFSNKTVNFLADRHGFDILEINNNYYDFPTDIFWSVKNYKYKFFIYILYPVIKFLDKETVTYVLQKR